MDQPFVLILGVIIAILGVFIAFVIWNMAETDAKRAAYYNILGPGGVGITFMKKSRRKGILALDTTTNIILFMAFIAIVIAVAVVFFGGAGKTSSELSFGLFDFVFS